MGGEVEGILPPVEELDDRGLGVASQDGVGAQAGAEEALEGPSSVWMKRSPATRRAPVTSTRSFRRAA